MHKLLFIIAFMLAAYGITRAQDFDYTVSTDSVAWNELSSQTILNANNSAWNFSYKIPIGFTFAFCGRNFDSLTIETSGYISFDRDRNYALTVFSGVGDQVDGNGNHPVLGYQLSGTSGNRVLKVQYLNCSPNPGAEKVISWQVWFKETGGVEVRVGPGTLRTNIFETYVYNEITMEDDTIVNVQLDSTQRYRIGLLNTNMDTDDCGRLLEGDPSDPETVELTPSTPDTPLLWFIPARGYRYTFTPEN